METSELLSKVEQAFTPAREIEVPELFSGREDVISQGLRALRSPGASLCIYGNRGVGKTSVAKQLRLVGAGLDKLPSLIGHPELFDPELFPMPTVYFACDDSIRDDQDLFRRILADRDTLNGICRYNNGVILEKIRTRKTSTASLTFKLLESAQSVEDESESVMAEIDPISAFKSVTSEIVDAADEHAMIVVIDEFERVADKARIASIIRTCPDVKFIIVGIAEDVESLILDHASVRRQFAEGCIRLEPMSEEMLVGIILRAQTAIEELTFEDAVITQIVALANGYPHWVHLIAKASCFDAIERGQEVVSEDNCAAALKYITRFEPMYDKLYREVGAATQERELALRLLAAEEGATISVSGIVTQCSDYGLEPEVLRREIENLSTAEVLRSVGPEQISFTDPRFQVFCRVREPVHPRSLVFHRPVEPLSFNLGEVMEKWQFKLSDYGYTFDLNQSYTTAAQFVPIDSDLVAAGEAAAWHWPQKKPTLYDSKGRPIR